LVYNENNKKKNILLILLRAENRAPAGAYFHFSLFPMRSSTQLPEHASG